jgi:class 3 adenylate cyclase
VFTAENGLTALTQIENRHFDLVLLDVMMPEMDGVEVLTHLKASEKWRDIPVIMISALTEIDSVVRCIELGAEDYLTKPFDPVLLRARIGAGLEKKRLRDREIHYLREIEAEQKRSDALLHVILPPEIVKELKETNAVKPREYADVSVLFSDVVQFTRFCDTHTPEEVLTNLQALIEAFEELSVTYGLQKIKTIGDAFMAVSGLMKPENAPVEKCVDCGFEMISAARRIPANWRIRIGVHVGPVMAGVVGHRQYLFDVWGDTVNTAQRIESHGSADHVCVSRAAWAQLKDDYRGESMGFVDVKGKGEMEIFRLLGRFPPQPTGGGR